MSIWFHVRDGSACSDNTTNKDGVTALYRRYLSPQAFDEVIGLEAVVRTLRNAIEHEQVRRAYTTANPAPGCDYRLTGMPSGAVTSGRL